MYDVNVGTLKHPMECIKLLFISFSIQLIYSNIVVISIEKNGKIHIIYR